MRNKKWICDFLADGILYASQRAGAKNDALFLFARSVIHFARARIIE